MEFGIYRLQAVMREHILVYDPIYLLYGGSVFCVLNILVFRWLSPRLSNCITTKYKHLHDGDREEWDNRVMSNFNAVVSILLSGYCLLYEDGLYDDKVWKDSAVARLACAVVVGYMVADTVCMVLWCKLNTGVLLGYAFHHTATVGAYYYISAYGVLCYFGMLRLIAEMSTPFVNQRWYFDTLQHPRTKTYVIINAFLMLCSFFVFRMLVMPVYWYQIWLVTGTEEVMKLGYIQLIMYIPCFVLDALNTYWFYKICKGFLKALKGLFTSNNNVEKFKSV